MVEKSFESLLQIELTSVPLEHWSDYLPVHVAALRFLEQIHPQEFSFLRATSSKRSYSFEGKGAQWYEDNIWALPEMQDLSHELLVVVLEEIKERYPQGVDTPENVCVPSVVATRIESLLRDRTSVFS